MLPSMLLPTHDTAGRRMGAGTDVGRKVGWMGTGDCTREGNRATSSIKLVTTTSGAVPTTTRLTATGQLATHVSTDSPYANSRFVAPFSSRHAMSWCIMSYVLSMGDGDVLSHILSQRLRPDQGRCHGGLQLPRVRPPRDDVRQTANAAAAWPHGADALMRLGSTQFWAHCLAIRSHSPLLLAP